MTQASVVQGFPLSPQQKRLWQLHSADSESPYRVEAVIDIQGPLQIDRLQAAFSQLVARHEILRTTFPILPGMTLPLQVIGDRPQLDLRVQFANDPAAHLNPMQDPETPVQVTCIQRAPDHHQLHVMLSALCMDGASLRQFVDELVQCYGGAIHHAEPLQYADIATWQNDLLTDPESEMARRYWQQLNLDAIAIQLPTATANSAIQPSAFRPQRHSVALPPELLTALQIQAERYSVPLASVLLSCWFVLLKRLTQAHHLVVGLSSEGRHYDELATALGPLTKVLPVSVALDDGLLMSALVAQVHVQAQAALDWQDAFDWSLLSLPNAQSQGTPFCPFGFAFTEGENVVSTPDLSFTVQRLVTYCDRFSIQLNSRVTPTGLELDFYYNTVEYSTPAIAQLAGYFQTLLRDVAQQPDAAINRLQMLSQRDRQHLLTLNQTTADYTCEHTIHQLFEAQAQRTPDALAVVWEQQSLTYAELNARATQLAYYLQQQGVGPEVIVGLWIERSLDMIVGLLAILKAGGAFLPLDPSYPTARLSAMLQDAQVPILLTQSALLNTLPATSAQILCLDAPRSQISTPLSSTSTPSSLAYVIYTSGSTGEPKGVAVEHRQLVNYVCGIISRLDVPGGSRFGLVSTIAADLGYTMLFPALCTGGCLHLISNERATDPVAFADYCRRTPLDVLKLTPTHLAALLTSQATDVLPRQRLILGGEALPWTLIQRLRQLGATCQIWNHYGPTEATIGVLTAPVPHSADTATVPLGQPLPNTQIYLLDEQQQPVPLGVTGEIYIGGAGLARGYLYRPELTQERFIANPFGVDTSEQLYRTGDRARYRLDGSLEFLGRNDDQIKIRGFRIELGEIERVLRQQPGVAQAVVVARSDISEQLQLVGYVVMQPSTEVSLDSLQQALQAQLPTHMVPTVVRLQTLPLLPNGKVDRQALPAPSSGQSDTLAYVAPRTPVELALAEIWGKLLGLSQVGIHDNFFALGGDSILSIQMIARAHQRGVRLTPKQIYQHQTIAELATVADITSTIQAEQHAVTGLVPLTPIQHWFFEQAICDRHHWNQAVLLEPQEALEPQVLQQAVQHLLQHHDALRSRFQQTEQGWQQRIYGFAHHVPVEWVDLTSLSTSEQWQALEHRATECQRSLDLTTGDVVRFVLFALNVNGTPVQRLLIVIHHLVVDGVSWRILLDDLQTAYQHVSRGQTVQLPTKTTSVQQWSQCLQDYAQSERMQQEASYWQRVVSENAAQHLEEKFTLPVDHAVQSISVASLQTLELVLNPAETQILLHDLPQTLRVHVQEVLLTALVQTLTTWTRISTVALDLEGHGREDLFEAVDLSRTVGWFTTLFPVQLTLPPGLEGVEALQSIKTQLRQVPQGGIGYGVWRYLSADGASLTTVPQVRFNYLGQADAALNQLSLFRWATEACGSSRSDRHCTPYLLDISGLVQADCLRLSWSYSDRTYYPATMQHLVQQFEQHLRSLLRCRPNESLAYSPTDFPLANVNQTDLNKLLLKLSQPSGDKLA